MTAATNEMWKQLAHHIGEEVRNAVNTPEMIGTDDETGYVLMFFNTRNHQGRSTLISSEMDRVQLKRLLKYALQHLDGPKVSIIEPGSEHYYRNPPMSKRAMGNQPRATIMTEKRRCRMKMNCCGRWPPPYSKAAARRML
jgi:hypothetical protein